MAGWMAGWMDGRAVWRIADPATDRQTGRVADGPIDRKGRTDADGRGARTCPTCPPPHSLTPSYGSAPRSARGTFRRSGIGKNE